MKIKINDKEYELLENYKDGFNQEEFTKCLTEFYDNYDYILGDWSYGKLRLKGFCDKSNKNLNNVNDIKNKEKYIKEECAYECKYFLVKICRWIYVWKDR